jgi:transposase
VSAKARRRTRETYLAAQYGRAQDRRGHGRAMIAVAHSILVIAYHLLSRDEPYSELGIAHYLERHSAETYERKLVGQPGAHGLPGDAGIRRHPNGLPKPPRSLGQ